MTATEIGRSFTKIDEPPSMRALHEWEREFLLRCWDRLHKTPMRRHELSRLVNGLLWCFPEVRTLPRGTEFKSPKGRTWSISKNYEPEFTVDKLISEITDESLIGLDRAFDMGYQVGGGRYNEKLIYET